MLRQVEISTVGCDYFFITLSERLLKNSAKDKMCSPIIDLFSEAEDENGHGPPSEADNDDSTEVFQAVLAQLQRDEIIPLAQSVRQRLFPDTELGDVEILDEVHGSFNILFPVQFCDGRRWLLKIPCHGSKDSWTELAAKALIAEATTLQALKIHTTILVPQVFDFSATIDNALGCPYILFDYLDGVPLNDMLFANRVKGIDYETIHQYRINALRGIASAMRQLSAFTSTEAGSPVFDSSYRLTGVSTRRHLNAQGMQDRWHVHNDPSCEPMYIPMPPISDPKKYYTFPLDLRDDDHLGLVDLLRQLIQWVDEPPAEKPFVLAHPDFNPQNILVTEQGELCGIIDWDGVATMPHSLGNLILLLWLTRDWDPFTYGYNVSMEECKQPVGCWENSPAELTLYRPIYRGFAAGLPQGAQPEDKADVTSRSLILDNLHIATQQTGYRYHILSKLLEEMHRVINGKVDDYFSDVALELQHGRAQPSVVAALKAGFEAVLKKSHKL